MGTSWFRAKEIAVLLKCWAKPYALMFPGPGAAWPKRGGLPRQSSYFRCCGRGLPPPGERVSFPSSRRGLEENDIEGGVGLCGGV